MQGFPAAYHNLGPPSYECSSCHAIMWYAERNDKAKRVVNPTFSRCCQGGNVLLPRFKEAHTPLNKLLDYNEATTARFKDQIRVYNNMFYFTSFGSKIEHTINTGRGPYTFRINGQNYHRMGSLLLAEGVQPSETCETVDGNIVASLIQMLDWSSLLAKSFQLEKEWFQSNTSTNFGLRLLSERTTTRQYNAPTISEVAALIVNDFGDGDPSRDISDINAEGIGKRIVSPKTFIGGLRDTCAVVYVIEFQKHGLPYAYILLWLKERCKCRNPTEIDDIISAELPSPIDDPDGYKVVTEYMLHGPCGEDSKYAPCTTEGKCSKHFPKSFVAETVIDADGYAIYRRMDNKVTAQKANIVYNNKHVVPYNRSEVTDKSGHIEALTFDMNKSQVEHEQLHSLLNPEQRLIYDQDEAPMIQRYAFEALDKTLRDILGYKSLEKRNAFLEILAVGGETLPEKKEWEDEPTWIQIPE
ncbi:hypothetical protein Tco_1402615 [Tanacetum coccineum]